MKQLTVKNEQTAPVSRKTNLRNKLIAGGLAVMSMIAMAPMALAQAANSIGGVSNTVGTQIPQIVDLMTKAGFALGVVFLLLAISKFRQHHEDARSVPMKVPVVLFVLSICLIALPWVVSVGKGTLGVSGPENQANGSVYQNF